MRILTVASLTMTATANYLVDAMRRAGHELLVVSDVHSAKADVSGTAAPDLDLISRSYGFVPEIVLFVEGGTHRLFPVGFGHFDCPVVWYAIDTHTDFSKHIALARCFDHTFVAQKRFVDALERQSGVRTTWLPLAFPSEFADRYSAHKDLDLAFVGSVDPRLYPGRSRALGLLGALAATAETGSATPSDMMERYGRAKVVFNQCANADLNMRFFEAMGSGAVLLTDSKPGLHVDELFEDGVHYLSYADEQDMLAKFKMVLRDPVRCRSIGDAARERVLSQHTYDHRVEQIVQTCRAMAKSRRPSRGEMIDAFAALNMPAEALVQVMSLFGEMGRGTRIGWAGRVIGWTLWPLAMVMLFVFRLHSSFKAGRLGFEGPLRARLHRR